jgi:SAM-dependent methyltransferase
MDLKITYNKIAEDWSNDHQKDTWWQEGTDIFLSFLPKGSTVLDVGCGGGFKTNYIAEKGYVPFGIDFSEKMIEIAKRQFPHLPFEVMNVEEIDKLSDTFNGVFAQAVLLHIPKNNVREILKKLKSKVNENGFLYLGVKGIKEDNIEEKVIVESDYGYEYERFFSFFNKEELRNYFKELDMEVVWESREGFNKSGWLQMVGKKK